VISRAMLLAFLLGACGDNLTPAPDPSLPVCADLGCPDPASSDKRCAEYGECTCAPDRGTPVPCRLESADVDASVAR
jgi:hypothetical protein